MTINQNRRKMRNRFLTTVAAVAAVSALVFTAPAQAAGVNLAGKGSSFANNAMQACLASYTTNTVTYTSTGSGTGRSEFAKGNVSWAASDGTYATTDNVKGTSMPSGNYVTVPLLGGPVVFAYSLPTAGDGLNLTSSVVSKILKGQITSWNDPAIKALNPKFKLPAKAKFTIKVAYRASGSGTTANLTNYLSQTSGDTWLANNKDLVAAAGGSGSFAPQSTSFATSSDLAGYIEDTAYSFGYFDLSDAVSADVSIAKLQNAAGAFVAPTASSAAKFLAAQSPLVQTVAANGQDTYNRLNGTLAIDFTKNIPGAYQLSIVTYGLAPQFVADATHKKSTDATGLAVQDWFKYVVSTCVPAKASSLGYVALTGALKASALAQIKTIG
jgi:phosphate transport system substrate-binding protein